MLSKSAEAIWALNGDDKTKYAVAVNAIETELNLSGSYLTLFSQHGEGVVKIR